MNFSLWVLYIKQKTEINIIKIEEEVYLEKESIKKGKTEYTINTSNSSTNGRTNLDGYGIC